MEKPLTIKANDSEIEIKTNKSDYLAAFIRGVVGAAPGVGAMAAELITSGIPNQKLDRVILFIKLLEDKLKYVEADVIEQKFKTDEFADLLEDALAQASRALTSERREQIANLLKNSLTNDELEHLGKKKLLTLLNRLNDAEIKLLYYYSLDNREKGFHMQDQNSYIKTIANNQLSAYPDKDEEVIYGTYKGNLFKEELIIGGVAVRTTPLAKLLLKFIEPTYK